MIKSIALDNDPSALYKRNRKKCFAIIAFLCVIVPLFIIFSSALGVMKLSPFQIARIVFAKITSNGAALSAFNPGEIAVIWELRIPRLLCAAFAGSGLAVSGVIFQSILQNPLADPYTLGISTGAAFGASIAILFNVIFRLALPSPVFALLFAALTLAVVLLIAERGSGLESSNLIMAGIIVSAVLQAGISFIKMISGENVGAIVFWLMGSLAARSWNDVLILAPAVSAALIPAIIFSQDLNILSLGSRSAQSMGLNVQRARILYLLLGAIITACCVSVCGIIGFVGLVVPHLLRFTLTSDNRLLLPLSALSGALLLTAADNCVRLLSKGEIPVGVLTTLLGGPFFIYIFLRKFKRIAS
ncbi:corrinoid ABC transporter permease [Spirochaetia bacterium]|nr:corrinoid ABC transporter permease [Spirochaetia bacterium]